MTLHAVPSDDLQTQLGDLFGSYKAEWLNERLFDLFTEPTYFPELTTGKPCILIGGRGTGKTTVLRGLSYEGQLALNELPVASWPFFGMYHRVNTNRVTAFQGPERTEPQWVRIFAHYFNLVLCELVLEFLEWYEIHSGQSAQLSEGALRRVAASLSLGDVATNVDLAASLELHRVRFESFINNIVDESSPPLSMQGAPVDLLFDAIAEIDHLRGRRFFFLLDEYENFLDYQQKIVNTLLKHSAPRYAFKIGTRELGWRVRTTLNSNEQLVSPADYGRIHIAEKLRGDDFSKFAEAVCNDRLSRIEVPDGRLTVRVTELLPTLSEDREAELLGIDDRAHAIAGRIIAAGMGRELTDLSPSKLELYLLEYWASSHGTTVIDEFRDRIARPETWHTRLGNYQHALLFTLRRGKRGIRKYYAGWPVLVQMAAGNIRYLLELVDGALTENIRRVDSLSEAVPPEVQTDAAQRVGRKNLSELEGLSVHGAQLTKLLLGLGRVFQVMAGDVQHHAPEVTQFALVSGPLEPPVDAEVTALLDSAVMHLALLRATGTKLASEGDTMAYDYMVHPVFSAFFVFSHRRKRKMLIEPELLLGLTTNPAPAIRQILGASGRFEPDDLPEQLRLFEAYYRAN